MSEDISNEAQVNIASENPVAVVTGASAGIGAAITRALATAGYTVFAGARRLDRIEELARQYDASRDDASLTSSPESQFDIPTSIKLDNRGPGKIVPVELDLRDLGAVEKMFADVESQVGRLDVLVNNAGLGHSTSLMNGDTEKWREMLEVNVLALCVCTREAVRRMQHGEGAGQILHLSSMSAHRVPEGSGVYSATKFAVRSLTEGLRKELRDAKSKIRVTSLSPGFVETEFALHFHQDEVKARETYERFDVLQSIDVANMVLWVLAQPAHVEIHDLLVRPTEQLS